MKKFTITLLCSTFLALFFSPIQAQWSADPSVNTPIVVEPLGKQIDLRMLEDGVGGAFIVWKDYRASGIPDIYIQRINASGVVLWTVNGVGACTDFADQSTPFICTDENGGCIIAWSDWRSGIERDLYAQRFDANGNALWTAQGAPVAIKNDREHNERLVSDGTGGAIVVWEQQTGAGWDVWAQRINASGVMVWTSGGIPVSSFFAYRINGRIQEDGSGGAIIAWQETHNGFEYDIYAQHFDANGTKLWGAEGIPICAATGVQNAAKIERDYTNGGAYIAWADRRGVIGYDVYAQRVDGNGNILWATDGVPVTVATGSQSAIDILSNPDVDGVIVSWKDFRAGNYDIYAQKIDSNGVAKWTTDGVAICTSVYDQVNPNIVQDLAGGAIICWQDSSVLDWNVKAQRIDSSGNVMWTVNGEDVGTAVGDQTSPKNCTDGNGGTILAFQDKRTGTNDIYAHHLFYDGNEILSNSKPVLPLAFSVYPNPFSSTFTLVADCETCTFHLTTIAGQVIWSGTAGITPDFSHLESGIYLLTPVDGSAGMKLIKQ
jgi:hypothetical protein